MAEYGGRGTALVVVGRGGRECAPASEEEEAESGSTGGGVTAKIKKGTMGALDVARKPRGRPPGSKNKPKPPIVITRDAENAMRPHVLELCAGCDVVESVAQFARRHHLGLCVISGKGTVANVSLHHPATVAAGAPSGRPSATTLTFHGRFDILSLTGTYLLPTSPSSPSTSSFTISLAGAQGQVVGGTVAGSLVAASPVVLIAAAFNNPSFHRLPAEDEDVRMNSGNGCVGGGVKKESETEMDACSMSMYNPLSCQLPHDAFTWVPPSRAPPPY
ncbi:AT-hook motif nuclear-localized protein 17-like [Nymphaea colorata]|uniref:AT-hook motif nuclear-localized protein n=1 Tax=Nymphaea colorata TaxID=210225 RepID=A0A5K1ANM1_9MAGN|nr:AT-hook motif nuclear-localized protein 17-like [Nymphaea colorata]